MENVLEARSLTKRYKGFTALSGLTLNVPQGSVYGLVGKNGAGKTTFMRLVCGLQEPSGGDYSIYGTDNRSRAITSVRRRIGAMVESPAIYPEMTARENLLLQYRLLGVPSDKGAESLLELVGLGGAGSKKAKNFSLGMRQRLGFAVALAGSPDLLLLGEPTNGLDPQGIVEMRELILRLNREQGITVVISSHILDELSRLATHYCFIDSGRAVREISASQLESACRKSIHVVFSDEKAFARTANGLSLDYRLASANEADIYTPISVTRLALAANGQGCEILRMSERDESLEGYFMELVGGERNDKTSLR